MYKLIRIFNQNREKIIKTILIIVFIIGIIQLLDYFARTGNQTSDKSDIIVNNQKNYDELISDKSLISGQSISEAKLNRDTNVINQFIDYCNGKDLNSAYELLTEECKENMFPTINDFYNIYYMTIFNNSKTIYTIENWVENTYQVRFTEDILSSGSLNGNETKQDFITIVSEDEGYKLNINSYVGRKYTNKVTENKGIEFTIISIDTYMDYEIYNLSIKNNSDNTVLLSTNDVNTIYLLDNNDMKYYFYNNEIVYNRLLIESKFTNTLQIKFNNSYSSSRKIKNMVFSKLILNYEEYTSNILNFKDFYEFRIDV